MKIHLKKWIISFLVVCFAITGMAPVALAYSNGKGHNGHKYEKHGNRYDREERDRFVLKHLNVSQKVLDYARRNKMTMRDIMIAKRIAEKSPRIGVIDVLKLRKKGHTYRSIANRYQVRWDNFDDDVNNSYNNIVRDAIKIGLVIWALDELLN